MENIYSDIALRTQGDIYLGIVGPVRTGKSTFIKKFMDYFVLPKIDNPYKRDRAADEMPQSAEGRTIMTTEPKFIPNEAVKISLDKNNSFFNVRLIDCVGYIVPGAIGYMEENSPRMVKTPWSEEAIPFNDAAEFGTKKVINEHSTIGLVITTDGSITGIQRSDYIDAEGRVIEELKAIGKPFMVLLNSVNPESNEAIASADEISKKYDVSVKRINCAEMTEKDITSILESVLYEFPVTEIDIDIPPWIDALSSDHKLKSKIYSKIRETVHDIHRISQISKLTNSLSEEDFVTSAFVDNVNLGTGTVSIKVTLDEGLFYGIIKETTGFDVDSDEKLLRLLISLSSMEKEYTRIKYALHKVRETGYGVVTPAPDELSLEEPEIIRHGGKYGVRLSASAPSIHIMCNKPKFLKTA